MFTWINKQGVRNEQGWVVQCVSRFEIEYREEGRVMTIASEPGMQAGNPCVIVASGSFSQWDQSLEPLSADEQSRIRANFVAAMEFQGVAVDI